MRLARLFLPLTFYSGCSTQPEPTSPKVASDGASSSASRESDGVDPTTNDGDPTGERVEDIPPEIADGSGECSGAASEKLLAALRNRGAASRRCFEALLDRGTEASGQIKVALEIAESGEVQTFDLEGDDVRDELFHECLAEHFRATYEDSPPENGCVTVKVPLNFSVRRATATSQ